MTIDTRTRLHRQVRTLARDEVFDAVLPEAISAHGDLAARGVRYKELPTLGLDVMGRGVTLRVSGDALVVTRGVDDAGVVAALPEDALSDLVQDSQSTMGLAMTSRVKITAGNYGGRLGKSWIWLIPENHPDTQG